MYFVVTCCCVAEKESAFAVKYPRIERQRLIRINGTLLQKRPTLVANFFNLRNRTSTGKCLNDNWTNADQSPSAECNGIDVCHKQSKEYFCTKTFYEQGRIAFRTFDLRNLQNVNDVKMYKHT
ncbi:hypothetical protein BLOT_007508 [Blomia tropicalis]|nr:hypothetical protein BLOT_007508 [Blomia tropicalis]